MNALLLLTLFAHDPQGSCCTPASLAPSPTAFIRPAQPLPAGAVAGTVKGAVMFDGEKPEVEPIEIVAEKAKGCVPEGQSVDSTDSSLLIGSGGGVANVVVTIEVKGAEVAVPDHAIELDQKGCRFHPHVLAIPAGATVEYLNSDSVSHNVHTYPGKNDAMNKTIGAGSKETQTLGKADRIEIKCDIHPWMNSWLIVSDTPHMAVTGADGSFAIEGVPPGEYEAELWHERLGKGKADVVVKEDGSSEMVEIKMGEEKKSRGRRR